jgi:hypothetical protein
LQAINLHFFKCDFARRVICGDCVPNIDWLDLIEMIEINKSLFAFRGLHFI